MKVFMLTTACGPDLPQTLYADKSYDLPEVLAKSLIAAEAAREEHGEVVETRVVSAPEKRTIPVKKTGGKDRF